jgi:hypothetical protein
MGQSLMIINFFSSKDFINCFIIFLNQNQLVFNSIEQPELSGKISFYNFPIFQAASK